MKFGDNLKELGLCVTVFSHYWFRIDGRSRAYLTKLISPFVKLIAVLR